MSGLTLYGTSACHLCEEARAILDELEMVYQWQDIALDEALVKEYGIRIPVLRRHESGEELDWPFNGHTVLGFLRPPR